MQKWSVEFTKEAEKDISVLDKSVCFRIIENRVGLKIILAGFSRLF